MSEEYFVEGEITIRFEMDVDGATSLEDAEAKAIEIAKDYYRLNVTGAFHDPDEDVDITADAGIYEEDEE
jgi:hypothetical protein